MELARGAGSVSHISLENGMRTVLNPYCFTSSRMNL